MSLSVGQLNNVSCMFLGQEMHLSSTKFKLQLLKPELPA